MLTDDQKRLFCFEFTVSNSSESVITHADGSEEKFGLNTSIFPNLQNTVNMQELSEDRAKNLHRKLVWDKYLLHELVNIEICAKIYDIFFMFSDIEVTSLVRRAIREVLEREQDYNTVKFNKKEVFLINDLSEGGRGQKFLNVFIMRAKNRVDDLADKKRIEKKPTIG